MIRKRSGAEWLKNIWRPLMSVLYLIVCAFDFVIFPASWPTLQAYMGATTLTQWEPTTLQGGGLFHIAMGAILGITAWTRGTEKIAAYKSGRADLEEPEEDCEEPVRPPKPQRKRIQEQPTDPQGRLYPEDQEDSEDSKEK